MSWNDTVKAAALAAQGERTAKAGRIADYTPWSWNPHDVWLSRVKQPREVATHSTLSGSIRARPDEPADGSN
ncbi:MAG: hypothetical protein IPJ97_01585 [Proteobacteria bacterium]|nr:hypothetical protein [Pseudomonadota bacterium]